MKNLFKALVVVILSQFLVLASYAGEDGTKTLSNSNKPVKDCFEKLNRGIFAFNQGLDKALFEPIATGYSKLPTPIKNGSNNFVSNISN